MLEAAVLRDAPGPWSARGCFVRRVLAAVLVLAGSGLLTGQAGARAATGGALGNGTMQVGAITGAGQTDSWTFTATAGQRIAVHIGEIVDDNRFQPWIRLMAPNGQSLGNTWNVSAAAIEAVAPSSGQFVVLVASADPAHTGTGTYRLTMAHTPGPVTTSPGDEGGALTNGSLNSGEILRGDLDVWTLTAKAGQRIAVHVGEVADKGDFQPWIRLFASNGQSLGNTWNVGAASIEAVAPTSGTYLVLVASADPGVDGAGTYRLTMTQTHGKLVVSSGDQGGPLKNGALNSGQILRGDLDVWKVKVTAGQRIGVHVGEVTDTGDFQPWIRLWGPNGQSLGNTWNVGAASIEAVAPTSGTYLVLVASADPGVDGTGTYRLTMTHTPGPIVVSAGDQGGALGNGSLASGEILEGDADVWTITATAGDRIGVHIGEVTDTGDFQPWIRLWGPNGQSLGNTWNVGAASIEAVAPTSGSYLVVVASADPGVDGTGTYRLTTTRTPGPITVSPGDQGGALGNGSLASGEILEGDVDVWTITATAGDRIGVHVGEVTDTGDFQPWIRLWGPNGQSLGNTWNVSAASIEAVAPTSGTYLVLVASADPGVDGTGTYRLTATHTPGPIVVSPGDQGGSLTSGVTQHGEILQGDLDVWTITATAGQHIAVSIAQASEIDDFQPWIRLWSPSGASVGNTWGATAATISATAPVTGTYLIPVASADPGVNGTGTYTVRADVSG